MIEYIRSLDPPVLIGLVIALVLLFKTMQTVFSFVFHEIWQGYKAEMLKHDLELSDNTTAILKLESRIETFVRVLDDIPKLKSDLFQVHTRIQILEVKDKIKTKSQNHNRVDNDDE